MGWGQCVNIRDHNIIWRREKNGGNMTMYNRYLLGRGNGAVVQGWGGMGAERIGWEPMQNKRNHKTGPSSTDPSKRKQEEEMKTRQE